MMLKKNDPPVKKDVFQAIADPTRRAVLSLLAVHSMTAGAIAAEFNTARPTVSKHLKVLAEADLVRPEAIGREVHYHLNPGKMKDLADWLRPFQQAWESRFKKLDVFLQSSKPSKK